MIAVSAIARGRLKGETLRARAKVCDELIAGMRAHGLEPLETAKTIFQEYALGRLTAAEMRGRILSLRGSPLPACSQKQAPGRR